MRYEDTRCNKYRWCPPVLAPITTDKLGRKPGYRTPEQNHIPETSCEPEIQLSVPGALAF